MYAIVVVLFTIAVILYFVYILRASDPLPDQMPERIWHLAVRRLDSVIDGARFNAEITGRTLFGQDFGTIRINGIEAPSISDRRTAVRNRAEDARETLAEALTEAETIHLYNVLPNGPSNEWVADVFCDRSDLAKMLIEKKVVKAYNSPSSKKRKKTTPKRRKK